MRKLFITFTLFALFATSSAFASIYGVLEGKVVDDDGKPLASATVVLQGTNPLKGARTKADGTFVITNITAGSYKAKITFTGKTPQLVDVRISADQTTNLKSIKLQDDAVMMDTVVVTAKADAKKVDVQTVGSINTLSGEDLTRSAGSNIADVVGMSAGVSSGSDGYSIRGSRPSETQIRLDGLNMGDQFSGGFGASGSAYFPMVSSYATEEIQVITGNFAAQYGDAQGGIVNSVMKTGRTDRYEGFIHFATDVPFMYGSQASGTGMIFENGKYRLIDQGEGAKLLAQERKDIDVGFGGAIPGFDRATFYITASNTFVPHTLIYAIKDLAGDLVSRFPIEGRWVKNFEGRLKLSITNDMSLVIGGKYGMTNSQSTNFRYAKDIGMPSIDSITGEVNPITGIPTSNGLTQTEGKISATNVYNKNVFARINHTLTDNSYYELTLSTGSNNAESSRKVAGTELGYFTGFELMQPEDNWIVDGATWTAAVAGSDGRLVGDKMIDWASPVQSISASEDGYFTSTFNQVNPFTGYYEGTGESNGLYTQHGVYNIGGTSGFSFRYSNFMAAAGDYNLYGVSTGDFKHTVKAGFEATYFTLNRHTNNNPYTGSPGYDVYSDMWGGNLYAETQAVYDKTSKALHEFKLGAYVQDQITYKGIVFNPGLRVDIMDPMSNYRVITSENPQFIPISSETGFAKASVKYKVSPRININYPITEQSYVSMSYGQFFQSPGANYLYDQFNIEMLQSGSIVGDPNMEPQQTNQYQVSYQNQLTDDYSIVASAYFKDIYNQLGVTSIMCAPISYWQYAVSEYGSSKGIELTINKNLSDYFGFSLNYTLAYLTVTSSDETSNTAVLKDPYTGVLMFPLAPFFSSNDIRHQVKGNLYFAFQEKDFEDIPVLNTILKNAMINFEPYFRTGVPYTLVSMDGTMYISDRNVYRGPSYWQVDAKIAKTFALKEWFGESMGNSKIQFYLSIDNIFNRRAAVAVYENTQDPLDNGQGLNYTLLGNFSQVPLYKEATNANPISYSKEQYDAYGRRLYDASVDTDNNGIITQQEKYDAYKRYYEGVSIQGRGNYQAPIRARFGVVVNF